MHADFTNQRAGKATRLTDGAHALGTAIAKRVGAWLLAWAGPVPAGFMPVGLRPGWMGRWVDRAAARTRPQCRGQAVAEPRSRFFGPRVLR